MLDRLSTPLAAAAAVALALAFDPASVRPFVGPKLALALALGSLAPAAALAARGFARVPRAALVAFAAHVAALAVATLFSIAPATSAFGDYYRGMGLATRVAEIAIALAAAAAVAARPARATVLLRATAAACAAVAAYGLVQALGLDPVFDASALVQTSREGVTELRIVSTLGHANFVGHLLLFGTGAAVALAGVETRTAARAAAALAGALSAAGVVASGSRGAWLGLAVQALAAAALAPWALGRVALTRRRVLAVTGVALVVVAAGAALARSPVGAAVATRALAFRSDGMTGSSRTLLWRDALPMAGRYAAHGCGPEAFALAFLPYESAELERREPYALYDSAHGLLLDAAIMWGALGAASLVALFVVAGVALARVASRLAPGTARTLPLGIAVALAGYGVDGLFVFDTIPTSFCFYLFVALAIGLAGAREEDAPPAVGRARTVVAAVLALASVALVWPRAALVLRSDRQAAAAVRLAAAGSLAPAIANGRASVANGEALGPAPELRHLLARAYARAGDPARPPTDDERTLLEAGVAEIDAALPSATTPQLLRSERADLWLRLGRTDAAAEDLREAIRIAPAFWPARARLARLLLETGDAEGAVREARAALDLNPESRDARSVLDDAGQR